MPVYALIVITIVVLLFICVGDVNTLAPVVTTAFMITYAAIDYSYFVLAMSYDRRQAREDRFAQNLTAQPSTPAPDSGLARKGSMGSDLSNGTLVYGSKGGGVDATTHKDSFQKLASDLDKLFPERLSQRGQHHLVRQSSFNTGSNATTPEADFDATKRKLSADSLAVKGEDLGDTTELLGGC